MKYYIVVFKNTHDAMAGEKYLKEKGYNFRIMPTPTLITQSCGICVRFEDGINIEQIKSENFEYKNVYCKDEDGYKEM